MVFGYLNLISIDFYDSNSPFLWYLVSIQKIIKIGSVFNQSYETHKATKYVSFLFRSINGTVPYRPQMRRW